MFQCAFLVAILCLAGEAFAAGVPKPVNDAVMKKYPDAKIVSAKQEHERSQGKAVYSVSIERGKQELEIDVDADGKIVSEESHVEFSSVPESIQKALKASKYGDWKVKRVERVVLGEQEGSSHFEILVESGKKAKELVFSPDGKLEKEETPKKPKEHPGSAKREVEQMEEKEHPSK